MEEGLFCHRPPFAHYGMQQCRDKSCRFCYERVDLTKRRERAMRFSTTQVHACLNQYQIYLNSNVVSYDANDK